jgi:hypothetical protein
VVDTPLIPRQRRITEDEQRDCEDNAPNRHIFAIQWPSHGP